MTADNEQAYSFLHCATIGTGSSLGGCSWFPCAGFPLEGFLPFEGFFFASASAVTARMQSVARRR